MYQGLCVAILLLCFQGVLSGQTLLPSEIEPAAFAELLSQNRQNNRQTFAAQLLTAERAVTNGDFTEAMIHYNKAATLGAPNSRWYLGKSALHLQLGEELNAQLVLKEGIDTYPFSNRLAMAYARQTFLRAERLPTDEEIEKMKLPVVAKVQVKALIAFWQKDLIRGLLETERAHYLAPDELIDAELAKEYLTTSAQFSLSYWEGDCGSGSGPNHIKYETGSFEQLYLNSIAQAVRKVNKLYQDSSLNQGQENKDFAISLKWLADVRVATLRDFVNRGHLGRFQDPMLVDLYILDKAGHLKGATAQLFLKTPAFYSQEVKEELLVMMPEMTAAQRYMDTQWSDDVDAFLAKF